MKHQLFEHIESGAEFSEDRRYRYALWRVWDRSKPLVMFIGLNPSTANESENDPTIKRVIAIARSNGFGGVYMMNCFPLVSTDPRVLNEFYDSDAHDTYDMENLRWLLDVRRKCESVVFAWGNFKVVSERARSVIGYFDDPKALHINKNGTPKHPLFCRADSKLIDFKK